MKSIRFGIGIGFISLLGLFASSCSNEIELLVEGPDTNVVYCLLDPDRDVQFARVGKTFDQARGHEDHYPYADSLIWQEKFTIYIEEWSEDGEIEKIYDFAPSHTTERDSGYFPSDGLVLFESNFRPQRLKTYAIYVHFEEDNRISSGWTTIASKTRVIDPMAIPGRTINLQSNSFFSSRWEPAKNAGSYQFSFTVSIEESLGGSKSIKQIEFPSRVFFMLDAPQIIMKKFTGNRFIQGLSDELEPHDGLSRRIVNVSYQIYIGGEELSLFLYPSLGESAITTTLNDYTNMVNGLGLFSSLSTVSVSNLSLSNATLDELAYSDETRELGFLDHYGKR